MIKVTYFRLIEVELGFLCPALCIIATKTCAKFQVNLTLEEQLCSRQKTGCHAPIGHLYTIGDSKLAAVFDGHIKKSNFEKKYMHVSD